MDLSHLNPEQLAAVRHNDGPLLVVAGAGTGKTQVITFRIARLIAEERAKPEEVLALTFTDKAAHEMRDRVDMLLPYGQTETNIATFHGFGEQLLRRFASDIGLDPRYKLMSKTQQIVLLKELFDELKLTYYAPIGRPDAWLNDLVQYFSRLKDDLISPERYSKTAEDLVSAINDEADRLEAERHTELARAYDIYCRESRKRGLLDFGDLLSLSIDLLNARPNVLRQIQDEFKFVLVDEFQDTNLAQNRLLQLVAGKTANIMAVGDDDQSIYQFRGAALSNILSFLDVYKEAKRIVLTQNYRSTQEILDAAYQLIQNNNPNRLESKYQFSKYLQSEKIGPKPIIVSAANSTLETDEVVSLINQELKAGVTPSEIAVLVRKRTQSELLARAFDRAGIAYQTPAGTSMYQNKQVRILMYFLQSITNPHDDVSFYHMLMSGLFKAEPNRVIAAASIAARQNRSLESVIAEDEEFEDQREILESYSVWRNNLPSLSAGRLSYDFIEKTGMLAKLVDDSKFDYASELSLRSVAKFFRVLADFEEVSSDTSAQAFAATQSALAAEDEEGSEQLVVDTDCIQMMTVHKSKGLEFETVILFDLARGTFPAQRRATPITIPKVLQQEELGDHLAEERRLMYVALTRAKNKLICTFSPDHGGKLLKKPSIFFKEAFNIEPNIEAKKTTDIFERQIELFKPDEVFTSARKPLDPKTPLVLTPHQIDDYLSCPENYRYIYILKVPEPPQPNLMYGSLLHGIIQQYYLKRLRAEMLELPEMVEMLDKGWRSDGFLTSGLEAQRRAKAEQTLQNFWTREQNSKRIPQHIEESFSIKLENNVVVRGRFDAVYVDPAGIAEIIDFKTSQVDDDTKANSKAKTSIQLAIYALAWKQLHGSLPERAVLDYIETGKQGVAVKSEKDMLKLIQQIQTVADGIRSHNFPPGSNHMFCRHGKVTLDVVTG